MNLVSGNIRFMGIFAGVPLSGGVKWQWGCRRRQFLAICVATSSETSEVRPAILHGTAICYPLSACNWLQNEWPRMTLSANFTSKSVFDQQGCRALTFALARLSCVERYNDYQHVDRIMRRHTHPWGGSDSWQGIKHADFTANIFQALPIVVENLGLIRLLTLPRWHS